MKQGRTLSDLATELERQANTKRDYLAPSDNLIVRSNGHTDLFIGDAYPVTDIAHGQIAEYLDVPKAFYDRLRGRTEDLTVGQFGDDASADQNQTLFDVMVNCLMASKGPQKRLVRTLDGNARAFLSDSYNPDLDNFDVFRVAATAIEQAGLGPGQRLVCRSDRTAALHQGHFSEA